MLFCYISEAVILERFHQQHTYTQNKAPGSHNSYSTVQWLYVGSYLIGSYLRMSILWWPIQSCAIPGDEGTPLSNTPNHGVRVLVSFSFYFCSPRVSREAKRAGRLKMHDFSLCHDSFRNFSSRLWEYHVFEGVFSLFLHFLGLYGFQGILSLPSKCLKALLSASKNLTQGPLFTLKAIFSRRRLGLWHYLPIWMSCQHFLFPGPLTHKECPGVLRPGHKLCRLPCSTSGPVVIGRSPRKWLFLQNLCATLVLVCSSCLHDFQPKVSNSCPWGHFHTSRQAWRLWWGSVERVKVFNQSLQPEMPAFQTPAELSLDKGREENWFSVSSHSPGPGERHFSL